MEHLERSSPYLSKSFAARVLHQQSKLVCRKRATSQLPSIVRHLHTDGDFRPVQSISDCAEPTIGQMPIVCDAMIRAGWFSLDKVFCKDRCSRMHCDSWASRGLPHARERSEMDNRMVLVERQLLFAFSGHHEALRDAWSPLLGHASDGNYGACRRSTR